MLDLHTSLMSLVLLRMKNDDTRTVGSLAILLGDTPQVKMPDMQVPDHEGTWIQLRESYLLPYIWPAASVDLLSVRSFILKKGKQQGKKEEEIKDQTQKSFVKILWDILTVGDSLDGNYCY